MAFVQFELPDDLAEEALEEARSRGLTVAELALSSFEEHLGDLRDLRSLGDRDDDGDNDNDDLGFDS
jgi:hypothetical protein